MNGLVRIIRKALRMKPSCLTKDEVTGVEYCVLGNMHCPDKEKAMINIRGKKYHRCKYVDYSKYLTERQELIEGLREIQKGKRYP